MEWPTSCAGWELPEVRAIVRDLGLLKTRLDGCTMGLVDSKDPTLRLLKKWTIATTSDSMHRHMHVTCPGGHLQTPEEQVGAGCTRRIERDRAECNTAAVQHGGRTARRPIRTRATPQPPRRSRATPRSAARARRTPRTTQAKQVGLCGGDEGAICAAHALVVHVALLTGLVRAEDHSALGGHEEAEECDDRQAPPPDPRSRVQVLLDVVDDLEDFVLAVATRLIRVVLVAAAEGGV